MLEESVSQNEIWYYLFLHHLRTSVQMNTDLGKSASTVTTMPVICRAQESVRCHTIAHQSLMKGQVSIVSSLTETSIQRFLPLKDFPQTLPFLCPWFLSSHWNITTSIQTSTNIIFFETKQTKSS